MNQSLNTQLGTYVHVAVFYICTYVCQTFANMYLKYFSTTSTFKGCIIKKLCTRPLQTDGHFFFFLNTLLSSIAE